MKPIFALTMLMLSLPTLAVAAPAARPIVITADAIPWSARPGSQFALLEGSMAGSGPYAFRIRFTQRGESDPEYHSSVDHIVVLRGTFYLGFGKRFERNRMRPLRAGAFAAIPRATAHFTMADPGTIIQVYGIGPRITTDMSGRPK